MSSSLQVGLRFRSPMRLPGCCCGGCCCYANDGTAEGRAHKRQHNSSTKEQLLWGGASLRLPLAFRGAAAVDPAAAAGLLEHRTNNSSTKEHLLWGGASLRSPLAFRGAAAVAAAAMPQPARPKAGPTKRQHNSSTKEQLLWGGASLRSPLAFRGAAAVDAAGLHEHRTNNSSTKEQLLWGGGFATARRWPCGGGEPPTAQSPAHRWILPSPLPPIGDSRKNNSTRKRKLLAPAAVGLRCARRSPWEESPRRC